MIRVQFHEIRWKNIMSYGDHWTTVQLDRSPSTVIVGKNGAGKSTICEVLSLVLFGRPYRRINKPELVNLKNGRDGIGEVTFTVLGQKYMVRRGIKPDIFEIYRDGVLIPQQGTARDYQKYLESIIRMDYASACQIIFVGKATHKPFMQLDAAGRRKFVEIVLNLLVFSNMGKLLTTKIAAYRNHLSEVKSAVTVTAEKIKMRRRLVRDLEEADRASAESDLTRVSNAIAECDARLAVLEESKLALGTPPGDARNALRERTRALSKATTTLNGLSSALDTNTRELQAVDTGACYACGREYEHDHVEAQRATLVEKREKLEAAIAELTEKIKSDEAAIDELEDRVAAYDDFQRRWGEIAVEVTTIESQKKHYLAELERDRSSHTNRIKETKAELKKLAVVHKKLTDKLQDTQTKLEYYDLISTLLTDRGIKAMVIKRFIPIINHTVNSHLAKLGLFANFEIDENFRETIKMRGFDTLGYNSFSEGEKLRMDMALLLAWREIARLQGNVSTNLLFLDEVADASMDEGGLDALSSLLEQTPNMNVFIITHTPEKIIDKVRSLIKIENVGGFSRIATADSVSEV